MQTKETAKDLIDSLPGDVSMDDIMHALYVHIKFSRGEEEIRQGKGVPHDQAKQRLGKGIN